ncbi:MAG: methyltransferase domain-containing protein [Gammaproteobacteria bacterium]|nr:methyltransferase domain-containing protein [Gammaproteobacteria bacterium]
MSHKKLMSVHPQKYAEISVLAQSLAAELLNRLEWVKLQPKVILDVGCGPGNSVEKLKQRYPDAKVIGIDAAYSMLQYAHIQDVSSEFICADAQSLPLANDTVDLLFANLVLPWMSDLNAVFKEWKRVLRPEGLLVFTSLGPDTLAEWRNELAHVQLTDCIDMHDIGDMLVRAKFSDPVMDVDYITLTYKDINQLLNELEITGIIVPEENNSYAAAKNKQSAESVYTTSYEIIYGHAWGPLATTDHTADDDGIVRIPLSHLRRRR